MKKLKKNIKNEVVIKLYVDPKKIQEHQQLQRHRQILQVTI